MNATSISDELWSDSHDGEQGQFTADVQNSGITKSLPVPHSAEASEFLDLATLPNSFTNQIIHLDNENYLAKIRSDVNCTDDCVSWIKEFGKKSFTKWILRSCTEDPPPEFVCRQTYICRHSSFRKRQRPPTKYNKNFNCEALISIIVENTANGSEFVRKGLPTLITIRNAHSHGTTIAKGISSLSPVNSLHKKFNQYFNEGFGIASSLRCYKANFGNALHSVSIPKCSTLKSWYRKWLTEHPIPIQDGDLTSVEDEPTMSYLPCGVTISEYLFSITMPKSFTNQIIYVDDENHLAQIRSDVYSVEDGNSWIKEFGIQNSTKWTLRSRAVNPPPQLICRRTFICQHSSYKKEDWPHAMYSKNFNCKAIINIAIENTNNGSKFVQEGLPALITIQNAHSHNIAAPGLTSFIASMKGVRMEFEQYFDKGLDVAASLLYHKIHRRDVFHSENAPRYSIVKHWYKKWRAEYPLPFLDNDDTSVTNEELPEFWLTNATMSEYLAPQFMPESFTSRMVALDDVKFFAEIRSNINSIQDCVSWVREFGKRSSTKWILHSHLTSPSQGAVCKWAFVCYRSSYAKKKSSVPNGTRPNKKYNCKARITFIMQSPSENNKYVKEGLPTLIVFNNAHSHSIITPSTTSRLLLEGGMQAEFETLFSVGLDTTSALNCYYTKYKDRISRSKMPNYGTVSEWHWKWQQNGCRPDNDLPKNSNPEFSESSCQGMAVTSSVTIDMSDSLSSEPETIRTNMPDVVKITSDEIADADFQQLLEEFRKFRQSFGISQTHHRKLLSCLRKITTREDWESFLSAAGSKIVNHVSETSPMKID